MTRRQKATPTTVLAESDLRPSSSTRQEKQDTNELQGAIAARAYALYRERGYRQGCDLQDWLDAEREILSRNSPV